MLRVCLLAFSAAFLCRADIIAVTSNQTSQAIISAYGCVNSGASAAAINCAFGSDTARGAVSVNALTLAGNGQISGMGQFMDSYAAYSETLTITGGTPGATAIVALPFEFTASGTGGAPSSPETGSGGIATLYLNDQTSSLAYGHESIDTQDLVFTEFQYGTPFSVSIETSNHGATQPGDAAGIDFAVSILSDPLVFSTLPEGYMLCGNDPGGYSDMFITGTPGGVVDLTGDSSQSQVMLRFAAAFRPDPPPPSDAPEPSAYWMALGGALVVVFSKRRQAVRSIVGEL